jgi:molecular chaperone GrpE
MTKKDEYMDSPAEETSSSQEEAHAALGEVKDTEGQTHPTNLEIVEALQKELDETRRKAEEYLDGWQRSRAEFTNYKKRVERDQSQTYQQAAGSVILRFICVLDDMERALKHPPQRGDGAAWAHGIELIRRKFVNILENEGIKPIDALGKKFDPNFHEAVTTEVVEGEAFVSGQIIEVLQQGYMLNDRVLRPAMVRVAQ